MVGLRCYHSYQFDYGRSLVICRDCGHIKGTNWHIKVPIIPVEPDMRPPLGVIICEGTTMKD